MKKSDLGLDNRSSGPCSEHYLRFAMEKLPDFAELQFLALNIRQKTDEVLIHRLYSGRQGWIVLGPKISTGVHGFSALFEAVLWTDPESLDD
jgi:hypothetical protein